MHPLSRRLAMLRPRYDVVVVGSGYGAAIAASRLARAGKSVCVLERGPERLAGEFPDTLLEASTQFQTQTAFGQMGPRTALFNFHVDDDIAVLTGCGLGGTSLINANVSLRSDPRVFDDPVWPAEIRADRTNIDACTARAEQMLGANPYPDDWPSLAKYRSLQRSGERLNVPARKLNINVTFSDGPNAAGVAQKKCTLCGDCVSGCNHEAKNTTQMNYLPDAVRHGAEIYTCVEVQHLERGANGGWVVHFEPLQEGRDKFGAPAMFVAAGVVVLGAGALGSAGILLRSRAAGLAMSNTVGTRFSGNGDVIGFAYNADEPVHGIGTGTRTPEPGKEPGPCITGVIDARDTTRLDDGFVIEEGVVPGAIGSLNPGMYVSAGPFVGQSTEHQHAAARAARTLESVVAGPYKGATDRAQTYLVMSHDDSGGRVELEDGKLRVRWPGVGKQPHFAHMDDQLHAASAAVNATYYRNPIWTSLLGDRLITVHPLGGAPMGASAETGTVNHKGQLFSDTVGSTTYGDLYVMCGSTLPRSVGVNPLITISAMAERNVALLAADRGWTIDYTPNTPESDESVAPVPTLEFTERMAGFWTSDPEVDFDAGAKQGKAAGSPFDFTLTILATDAQKLIVDPQHEGSIYGTVIAPALAAEPLSVSQGVFNLFTDWEGAPDERRMRYRMTLNAPSGRQWYFDGYKRVRSGSVLHAWPDTSTLFITLRDGADASAPVLGRGILHILPIDFEKQMRTMKVSNAANAAQRLKLLYGFGKLFAGALYETYGSVFGQTSSLQVTETVPRKRRSLRLPAPEVHGVATPDGTALRLTRYNGGTKGPLLAAPGFGTPAASFLIDTVGTNFTEFFVAQGYDVWLFDYRSSTALSSSSQPHTIDDVARQDWPAAVKRVRDVTGAPSVQVVAHCVGSLSFMMAQLAGLEGVGSAVCSALTVHPRAPTITEIKARLHLPSLLTAVGIETLSTDDDHPKWYDKALNEMMRLYPTTERCHSAVCRRILFMYGEVFAHDKLNRDTHDAIHEIFGVAHMKPFAQLAASTRIGHVVDAAGGDEYLPHADRFRIPVTFIHGERNTMFLPEGSRVTYEWLREHNGPALYHRIVIPTYAHMDTFIGQDADRDVFPTIRAELERHRSLSNG